MTKKHVTRILLRSDLTWELVACLSVFRSVCPVCLSVCRSMSFSLPLSSGKNTWGVREVLGILTGAPDQSHF